MVNISDNSRANAVAHDGEESVEVYIVKGANQSLVERYNANVLTEPMDYGQLVITKNGKLVDRLFEGKFIWASINKVQVSRALYPDDNDSDNGKTRRTVLCSAVAPNDADDWAEFVADPETAGSRLVGKVASKQAMSQLPIETNQECNDCPLNPAVVEGGACNPTFKFGGMFLEHGVESEFSILGNANRMGLGFMNDPQIPKLQEAMAAEGRNAEVLLRGKSVGSVNFTWTEIDVVRPSVRYADFEFTSEVAQQSAVEQVMDSITNLMSQKAVRDDTSGVDRLELKATLIDDGIDADDDAIEAAVIKLVDDGFIGDDDGYIYKA